MRWFYLWVPLIMVFYAVSAWITTKNNVQGGKWFWIACAYGVVPTWQVISRYSTNIVFDSVLYDLIVTLTFGASLLYFSAATQKYVWWQAALGLAFAVLGLKLISDSKI